MYYNKLCSSSSLASSGVEIYGREWGYHFTEQDLSGISECDLEHRGMWGKKSTERRWRFLMDIIIYMYIYTYLHIYIYVMYIYMLYIYM